MNEKQKSHKSHFWLIFEILTAVEV